MDKKLRSDAQLGESDSEAVGSAHAADGKKSAGTPMEDNEA